MTNAYTNYKIIETRCVILGWLVPESLLQSLLRSDMSRAPKEVQLFRASLIGMKLIFTLDPMMDYSVICTFSLTGILFAPHIFLLTQ